LIPLKRITSTKDVVGHLQRECDWVAFALNNHHSPQLSSSHIQYVQSQNPSHLVRRTPLGHQKFGEGRERRQRNPSVTLLRSSRARPAFDGLTHDHDHDAGLLSLEQHGVESYMSTVVWLLALGFQWTWPRCHFL